MVDRNSADFWSRRLPLYAYLAPLWQDRRVLEIGCAGGASADYLAGHGAERVVSLDTDGSAVERARVRYPRPRLEFRAVTDLRGLAPAGDGFDLVVVPDAQALLADEELIAAVRRMMRDEGSFLVVAAPSADRRTPVFSQGIGYYDVADALTPHFPVVRLLGQTPFFGFGLVEFEGASDTLRVDMSLVDVGSETPSHYVAIAGAAPPPSLGYALVQIPAAPVEARLAAAAAGRPADAPAATATAAAAGSSDRALGAAEARVELAERRLDEADRRGRARLEAAEDRNTELRRKLDEALIQSESSVRVLRAQGDEMEELRGRLRRAAEDRAAADSELGRLRKALGEADEAVLALTRRTAEEMSVVAQRMATGLRAAGEVAGPGDRGAELAAVREEGERLRVELAETEARAAAAERRLEEAATAARRGGDGARAVGVAATVTGAGAAGAGTRAAGVPTRESEELESRLRRAEEATARERAEVATLAQQLRNADEQIRDLRGRAAAVAERDDRIARLEGDKQDLIWRVAELEEKLRHADADSRSGRSASDDLGAARGARDRAIEEFHRAAAAHVNEVNRLQASVGEQAALVSELEDGLRAAEARAATAEKEASSLRRGAKELEEADRSRRNRLAELEGKLLRLEREKAMAAAAGAGVGGGAGSGGGPPSPEIAQRLQGLEQRALAAEQGRGAAAADADALRAKLQRAEAASTQAEESLWRAKEQLVAGNQRIGILEQELAAARLEVVAAASAASSASSAVGQAAVGQHNGAAVGAAALAVASGEVVAAIEEIEERLREEVRTLAVVEETLVRARTEAAGPGGRAAERTEHERTLATKDAQVAEGRLELARVRRDAEAREAALAREISELRARLQGGAGGSGGGGSGGGGEVGAAVAPVDDYSGQLILMHTTLSTIRRRAARLRDELEGFRRRLDTLPPGALSSMLEEIGEDLAEFAK